MAKQVVITEKEFNETRLKLIKAASEGKLMSYSDLTLENDSRQHSHLKKVLEAISLFEYKRKNPRPLLCSIVISKNDLSKGGKEPKKSFQVFCEKYSISTNAKTHQKDCFEKWGNERVMNEKIEVNGFIDGERKFKELLKVWEIQF